MCVILRVMAESSLWKNFTKRTSPYDEEEKQSLLEKKSSLKFVGLHMNISYLSTPFYSRQWHVTWRLKKVYAICPDDCSATTLFRNVMSSQTSHPACLGIRFVLLHWVGFLFFNFCSLKFQFASRCRYIFLNKVLKKFKVYHVHGIKSYKGERRYNSTHC